MDAQTWLAVAAGVVSLVALYFTAMAGRAARSQAAVAKEQTEIAKAQARTAAEQTAIQRQLREDAAQPYVWADLREDATQAALLHLELGNSGPTITTHVRVTVKPPLPATDNNIEQVRAIEARLATGIKSLAPGRILRWNLGVAHRILALEGGHRRTIRVEANGPFGPLAPLEYDVDPDDWRLMRAQGQGSLHLVRESIDRVATTVDVLASEVRRLARHEDDEPDVGQ
ncbi:hypothetical protein [Sinomonas atrocyanea]|uniref:hypothetical protein n=1 Tax=Sinomonas atrocyanea TaxID=37927 RepID=UPI0027860FB0|nr:hypothetical protein [Sinomonas atrocyanea]MDQ0259544.1 heme exporter protein D [Sinomonas atrocyanea]MDR6623197.1 heme exporter protein D [Sinomonas atrocyanea]